jgi:hypothetical protein
MQTKICLNYGVTVIKNQVVIVKIAFLGQKQLVF